MDRKKCLKKYISKHFLVRKQIEGWLEGQKEGWLEDRKKDGWRDIKMDGWMDRHNRWIVGWTGKIER